PPATAMIRPATMASRRCVETVRRNLMARTIGQDFEIRLTVAGGPAGAPSSRWGREAPLSSPPCRPVGVSGGRGPGHATFWLLEAPDSLAEQSRREPDGTGLGTYDADGHPVVSKQPIAAYEDQQFTQEAREVSSRTFIAHVRYASTGA